jgi:hypothetical protein
MGEYHLDRSQLVKLDLCMRQVSEVPLESTAEALEAIPGVLRGLRIIFFSVGAHGISSARVIW